MTQTPEPNPKLLQELVRRIVEVARPTRIILFGSAARGQMGPHSDLDVMIIVREGAEISRIEDELLRKMWGLGAAKDLIVVTESEVEKYGSNPYLIISSALREGKELYRAAG